METNTALDALGRLMAQRCVFYERQAAGLVQQLDEINRDDLEAAIYKLLVDAYRTGGRDLYSATTDLLAPLWAVAGLDPL